MGAAENWQTKIVNKFSCGNVVFLNPRRDDWDSSWTQTLESEQFVEQVNWELSSLEQADIVFMYYDPSTKSPISLLEMGLFAKTGKLIVVCPDGFWRKGNVQIVCGRYGIPLFDSLECGITHLAYVLKARGYIGGSSNARNKE